MSVALLLLPDFLLIALGAALKRVRGFDGGFWPGLERLVYFVLFPALLFRSLATSPLGLADAGRLVAVGLGFTLAGMVLSALAQPLFRLPHATFAACFQCGFRFNTYVALA
ncbi:MAG TPA: AEC family transporter, partial [Casimicrobiaceae bacterium]|nr:AEC family transporter [Casimicrobiaceae bacterium]